MSMARWPKPKRFIARLLMSPSPGPTSVGVGVALSTRTCFGLRAARNGSAPSIACEQTAPLLSDAEIAELHRLKTTIYADLIASGGCPLRPGVKALLTAALRRGQRLAIATTTSRGNIDALLASALGQDWADLFAAIVAGDEVPGKKPAPDVYLEVLSRLSLPASECLAIEDSEHRPGCGVGRRNSSPDLAQRLFSGRRFFRCAYCDR